MKTFFLYPNEHKDRGLRVTRCVAEALLALGGEVFAATEHLSLLPTGTVCADLQDLPQNTDAILSIGGDGTVLAASETALLRDLPLLGINLGRRGYLAALEPTELEKLKALFMEDFYIRELIVLRISYTEKGQEHTISHAAVNDVVFHRSSIGNTVGLAFSYEGESAVSYRGDGLILSTPTGSTAYSLSAGGPILAPGIAGITATPVCPHSFFNRPIVFGTEKRLAVYNSSEEDPVHVSVDGRANFLLHPGECVRVGADPRPLRLLAFEPYDFLGTLYKKMKVTD